MSTMIRIPGTNLEIFPLNLGGNTFGWTSDEQQSFEVLDAFVAAGGNFIDTADSYAIWGDGLFGGESEAVIGKWMKARGNRKDIIIATKVGGLPTRPGLSRENAEAALSESLERLQSDYIDIYYAHYDDDAVEIAEQVRIAHDLVLSGRVKHIALSNFTPQRMREWFQTARELELTVPVAIQPQYHLLERKNYEQDYAPIARDYGVAVFSYFSLASGMLTGKYRRAADLAGAQREGFVAGYATQEGFAVIDELVQIAQERESQPATVALAWLRAKGITAPIASARIAAQLSDLMAAAELQLDSSEVARLDKVSTPFA